jgi:hypothetical protein
MTNKAPKLAAHELLYQRVIEKQLESCPAVPPVTTRSECRRFVQAFGEKGAESKLRSYLEWRRQFQLDQRSPAAANDDDWWNTAVKKAFGASIPVEDHEVLPQFVHCLTQPGSGEPFCDANGCRVLHVLPALIDTTRLTVSSPPRCRRHHHHASSHDKTITNSSLDWTSVYTNVVALYLDGLWSRWDDEATLTTTFPRDGAKNHDGGIVLCLDVRAGRGWPNPTPTALLGFIRHVAAALGSYYPERLVRCLVYPVPWPAVMVWHCIQPLLSSAIRQRVVLVAGHGTHAQAALPARAALEAQVPTPTDQSSFWDVAEAARVAMFR